MAEETVSAEKKVEDAAEIKAEENDLSKCALLLIDIQKGWTCGDKRICESFPNFKSNVSKLLPFAREQKMEIIHIYADYTDDNSLWWKYFNNSFNIPLKLNVPSLTFENNPRDDDILGDKNEKEFHLKKSTFDAFYNTKLNDYLKEKNIKNIYFAGVCTSVCILMSMHGAFIRGYHTYIINDCCGDINTQIHEQIVGVYGNIMMQQVNIKDNLK